MGKTKIGSMKHLTLVEGDVNLLTNNEVLVSEEEDYTILRKLESGEIKTFVITSSLNSISSENLNVNLYPNPASNNTTLSINLKIR